MTFSRLWGGIKTEVAIVASSLPLAFFSKKVYKQSQKIFLLRKARTMKKKKNKSLLTQKQKTLPLSLQKKIIQAKAKRNK